MDVIPEVKGWKPFKSIATDIVKKEQKIKKDKEKEQYKKSRNECEMLDVPKDWKTPAFKLEDNPHKRLFAATEFKVLFSEKLEDYLKDMFAVAQKALEEHYIKAQLFLNDGEMIVSTTRKTFDPVMILKAHSVIKLISRYVPVEDAIRVLEDDIFEDIITISHHNKDTFHRRRSRLSDPSIKELIKEILDCTVYVAGKTVSAIGSYKNLNSLREVVLDCFDRNIHPIFNLKRLQIINKLKTMPEMEGKDWTPFLPKVSKKNVKRRKPLKIREKKEYEAFPPAPVETKIDKELEEGVFHLKYEKSDKNYYQRVDKVKARKEDKKRKKGDAENDTTDKEPRAKKAKKARVEES